MTKPHPRTAVAPNTTRQRVSDPAASDASLVVGISRFDEQALSEAYQRHGGAVFALAMRTLRNRTLAEDVTQEVFVRLWDRPERFDPDRGSLRAFLLADTHGRSIDFIRSEEARKAREEKDGILAVDPQPAIDDEVWSLVMSDKVRTALDLLTDDERAAIELAYFQGRTYREVAADLQAPEGTVKSRIRTGLMRLRSALAAEGLEAV